MIFETPLLKDLRQLAKFKIKCSSSNSYSNQRKCPSLVPTKQEE